MDFEGYEDVVKKNWIKPCRGRPMEILWIKLKRLQPALRQFSKPLANLKQNMEKASEDLRASQTMLTNNRMDPHLIENIRSLTEKLLNYQETENKVLMQCAKID